MGKQGGISFNTNPPTILTDGQIHAYHGNASISDGNGNLLFYSNGNKVWDRSHNIMPNGGDLQGDIVSYQSVLILPKPDSQDMYYIFTTNAVNNSVEHCLRYSVVDMTLNGGMGDIVSNQKNILINNDCAEGLSATIHRNGTDYWIIYHSNSSSRFYCNILSVSGINTASVINDITPSYGVKKIRIKTSSYSNKIVLLNQNDKILRLFNFDNGNGNITFDKSYKFANYSKSWELHGAEFSPNNKKLYDYPYLYLNSFLYEAAATNSLPKSVSPAYLLLNL